MNSRRFLLAAVCLVLAASFVMVQIRRREATGSAPPVAGAAVSPATAARPVGETPPASPVAPDREEVEGQPALNAPLPGELSTTDRPPLADALGAPATKPEDEPRIVLNILDAYRRIFRAYPAGENNRQLVNALLGANKEKLPFIPLDHSRLNAQGEIADAWGTPFFFHQFSRTSIEVRSAGPDRLLYTDDDLVVGNTASQPKQPTILETPVAAE